MTIREALASDKLTQQWLVFHLRKRGVNCDGAEVCRAVNGYSHTPKAEIICRAARQIIAEYEAAFGGVGA